MKWVNQYNTAVSLIIKQWKYQSCSYPLQYVLSHIWYITDRLMHAKVHKLWSAQSPDTLVLAEINTP